MSHLMMAKSGRMLVVGAGMSGAVAARELAEDGHEVLVIDRREHIAGNAYDYINDHGIRVHRYGPHIFHTSNEKVVAWLSRFTEWLIYQHRVKAMLADGRLVTLPVNLETQRIVGKDKIVETFYRPYTRKMWGMAIGDLEGSVLDRVPIRDDLNDLYFPDEKFQAMPSQGYTAMVHNILDHPRIEVILNQAFAKSMEQEFDHVFNSMAIDEYFDFRFGELPYRSIRFHHVTLPLPRLFPVANVNFTHDGPYTRLTEWKNYPGHGQNDQATSLTYEEPCDYRDNNCERYYPVKDAGGHNRNLYRRYRDLIPSHVTFIGRCGLYAYLDMHQAISTTLAALAAWKGSA